MDRPSPTRLLIRSTLLCLGVFACLVTAESTAQTINWTQWRGPNRDGVAVGIEWPDSLGTDILVEERTIELQPSYSGPIVVDDVVFVTETVDKKNETVKAIRISDGQQLWSKTWPGSMTVPFFAAANGSWIRATPAYDDGRLYVGGIKDLLVCLDARTGDEIWKRDFPAEGKSAVPAFGFASSPLVDGDHLYVQAGGGFQMLDKRTGQTVWIGLQQTGRGAAMNGSPFSSPCIATLAGKRQAIVQTRTTLHGVDLETGQSLWSQDIPAFRGMNIVTPTVYQDGVFVSTYGGTSQMLRVSQEAGKFDVNEAWKAGLQGYMTTPVVVAGHAYLRLKNQRLACFDLETGDVKWRTKPFGKYASLVAAGDKILSLDSNGQLSLIRANPEKFEQLDKRKVADDSWAHLAVTKDRIFVRDLNELKIFCWKK